MADPKPAPTLQTLHKHMERLFAQAYGQKEVDNALRDKFKQAHAAYEKALEKERALSFKAAGLTVTFDRIFPGVDLQSRRLPAAPVLALAVLPKEQFPLARVTLRQRPDHRTLVRLKLDAELSEGFYGDTEVVELGEMLEQRNLRPLPAPPLRDSLTSSTFSLSCSLIYDAGPKFTELHGIHIGQITLFPYDEASYQVYSFEKNTWIDAILTWMALVSPNGSRVRSFYDSLRKVDTTSPFLPRPAERIVAAAIQLLGQRYSRVHEPGSRSKPHWEWGHEIQPLQHPEKSLGEKRISAPDAVIVLLSILEMMGVPCGLAMICGRPLPAWRSLTSGKWEHLDFLASKRSWLAQSFTSMQDAGNHAAKIAREFGPACYQLYELNEARSRDIYPIWIE